MEMNWVLIIFQLIYLIILVSTQFILIVRTFFGVLACMHIIQNRWEFCVERRKHFLFLQFQLARLSTIIYVHSWDYAIFLTFQNFTIASDHARLQCFTQESIAALTCFHNAEALLLPTLCYIYIVFIVIQKCFTIQYLNQRNNRSRLNLVFLFVCGLLRMHSSYRSRNHLWTAKSVIVSIGSIRNKRWQLLFFKIIIIV